jgi:hypothetical protein
MAILPEAAKQYVGKTSDKEVACDVVEAGSVRRYAQAIMDEDPIYAPNGDQRYGSPVAPPFFPTHMVRRALGAPDNVSIYAKDPDFDGIGPTAAQGLPEIEPLRGYSLLNGGAEVEFYRYARHGETVTVQSRYVEITEKETSKGPIIIVVIESDYCGADGSLIVRSRRTQLRRK